MKLWSFITGLLATAQLTVQAYGYANPGACSGQCNSHDPGVMRRVSDGTYFRFETGSRIGIWKADDLSGPWAYQGAVVPAGSSINLPGRYDLWAPDVHYIEGIYYLFYSVSEFGSQNSAIGYATSPTMEYNTWSDHGSTGVSSSTGDPYNAIDGNLIRDTSTGRMYMNFGSFWHDIYQVPITISGGGVSASGTPYNIAYNSNGAHAVEGSYVYARNGVYWLFFSAGTCCGYDSEKPAPGDEYKVYVCRSSSVTGPFVDRNGVNCSNGNGGSLLLASHGYVYGPGGQGVMADPEHGTVLYYHYANTGIGLADADYQFGWNVVNWGGGWPSV